MRPAATQLEKKNYATDTARQQIISESKEIDNEITGSCLSYLFSGQYLFSSM